MSLEMDPLPTNGDASVGITKLTPSGYAISSNDDESTVTRGPQRIVILCDGTMQQRRSVVPHMKGTTPTVNSGGWYTNVALLAHSITQSASQPDANGHVMPQIVLYQAGIGTGGILDIPADMIASATGMTLSQKVAEAYAFLVDNYLPGDEIFLFGFSRGAYTARALANFLNFAGLLSKREHAKSYNKVWRAYEQRIPISFATIERAETVYYQETGRWPSGNGMRSARGNTKGANTLIGGDMEPPSDQPNEKAIEDVGRRYPRTVPPIIRVVAVWDTVGSMGIPGLFVNPDKCQFLTFFDPILAPNVDYAFHALALDEDRKDFRPTLWYIPPANREVDTDRLRREKQVLKQVWFQGSHTDVGGGFAWHGLSDITLAWLISELVDCPGGPLLNIDLEAVRFLQDRRRAWARQPEHPSRYSFEFQRTRNVGHWPSHKKVSKKMTWSDFEDSGDTNESIHYSVHVGNRYNPERSVQFTQLRKHHPKRLAKMWQQNLSSDSMGPTEKLLQWDVAQPYSHPDSAVMGGRLPVLVRGAYGKDEDTEIGVLDEMHIPIKTHQSVSARFWKTAKDVANIPTLAIAFCINRRVTPKRNLKPGALVACVALLQYVLEGRSKKHPLDDDSSLLFNKVNMSA